MRETNIEKACLRGKYNREKFKDFLRVCKDKSIAEIKLKKEEERLNAYKEYLFIYKGYSLFAVENENVRKKLFKLLIKKEPFFVISSMNRFFGIENERHIVSSVTRHKMKYLSKHDVRKIEKTYNMFYNFINETLLKIIR